MRYLIGRFLRGPARAYAIAAPLLMSLEVLMDLQQPTLMAKIIDVGVARHDQGFVLRTGALMLTLTILGLFGGVACSIFSTRASIRMGAALRQGLFEKVQSLPFPALDRLTTASLVTRLTNDVMNVQLVVMLMLRIMIRSPLMLIGSIFMACLLSPALSMVFCFAMPVVALAMTFILVRSTALYGRVQKRLDTVTTIMRENLLGARVAKAFRLEAPQAERFETANGDLIRVSVRAQGLTLVLAPVVSLTMNLAVVAVLWFGGNLVHRGDLELGKILAFINYLVQITTTMLIATNVISGLSRAGASVARIKEVFAEESMLSVYGEVVSPQSFHLEFKDVSFGYGRGGDKVLDRISFRVDEGQFVGIIGATGAGKSTLAALIPRLYDPDEGQILLGGVDLRLWDRAKLRRTVGLAMQESLLFSGTIAFNLRFGRPDAPDSEIAAAAQTAQADDFVAVLPEAYESRVEQRGRNFSGGQRQRLSVARALVPRPRLTILDDTASAVDMRTEARLRAALRDRLKGGTLIAITQRVASIRQADTIIVLEHGRVAATGTHSQLLAKSEIYRIIVRSQLGEEGIKHVEHATA
jgi:ATP-binding cassette subfamily B protein